MPLTKELSRSLVNVLPSPKSNGSMQSAIGVLYHQPNELIGTFRDLDKLPKQIGESELHFDQVNRSTIESAKSFISHMLKLTKQNKLTWVAPRVTTEGDGDVSFEWWRGECVLIITIEPTGNTEYLRVWGAQIWEEMESGEQPSDADLIKLWKWLYDRSGRR